MKNQHSQTVIALIILVGLTVGGLWPAAAQAPARTEPPLWLKLKYATFDPLAGEPALPADLRLDAYPANGEGAYIVQFQGPIQAEWKAQLEAQGGRVLGYLPDYAFLVWMDGATRVRTAELEMVRWVGVYQPAYKLSPNLDRSQPFYRVVLFEGADLAAVEARLKELGAPTASVPGERFTLFLPKTSGGIEAVAAWPEVLWIENRPLYRLMNDVAGGIMGAPTAWSGGYTGSGMTVTVADSGVDSGEDAPGVADMHADFDDRLAHISSWPVQDDGCSGCCYTNIGADDGAADLDSGHGTHVLGSVGGNGAASGGQIKGLAPEATLTFQAVEQYVTFTPYCQGQGYTDGYYLVGIPNDIRNLFLEAYNWGSRVHSNSWGSDAAGGYTSDSQAVDEFVWNHPDMVILFAAGNAGVDANVNGYVDEGSVGSPATAKNSITSGASENERNVGGYNPGGPCWTYGNCWSSDYPANPTRDDRLSDTREEMAAFSSRGPTDDDRLKPDIVAPGTNILSTRSRLISGHGWGPYTNSNYMYMGGTSMSNPLIAGAAALVREYYIEGQGHTTPSAALVKATLINSAVDITGYGNPNQEAGQPIPNNHEGWGRVDVGAATSGDREFRDWETVSTGGQKTYTYQLGLSSTPFKVTLAWSDYPASPPAGGLVNDLDLVVIAPDSTTYRGNNFSGGWSSPGGAADQVNNVESVYIQNPAAGQWTVRVEGSNVPYGPQPFALVATGSFGPPPNYDHFGYLPLVVRNFGSGGSADGIVNGDFESGPTAWIESSSHGWDLIVDSGFPPAITPYSGSWAAWLGRGDNEVAYIQQQVTIPSDSPWLVYQHWIESGDLCGGYDVATVRIDGAVVDVYDLCWTTSTGGWEERAINLSTYAGQAASLQIRVETDAITASDLFIDDVSFRAGP